MVEDILLRHPWVPVPSFLPTIRMFERDRVCSEGWADLQPCLTPKRMTCCLGRFRMDCIYILRKRCMIV